MKKIEKLNRGWLFHKGKADGADFMGYDDRGWREVTLPHDWSVESPFDRSHASGTGYLPGGSAWYRKHFTLPEEAEGKRVRLTFGGVYKHARVWINSNYLGFRACGYTTFTFDVTEFVHPGENVIAVFVEHEEVADSRWFTGSGIYRDVTLEITDLTAFRENGIFVTTKSAEKGGEAVLEIRYETLGADGARFELLDPKGDVRGKTESRGGCGTALLSLEGAELWSPETPVLYTLRAAAEKDGKECDGTEIAVGIRTAVFDPDRGFLLNGKETKLRGVCLHHDAGALGAAVPGTVWERRLKKLKEMGANALRTAHNPPDPVLLDLADRMGFLVMDEAFDEWEGAKNKWWQGHNVYPPKRFGYAEDFPEWHRFDLESMVKRDRNHPSVILWSIGNEIDYPNDPYVTPLFDEMLGNNDNGKPAEERRYDPRKPDAGRLASVAKELLEIVHGLDETRPVLSALSFPELSNRTGFAEVLDAVGYNYRERFYEEDHAAYPERIILGSENGHAPDAWYIVRDNPYVAGQFLWTGVDFLGECRGWPYRISQAGLLDLAGFEKPLYYQRKALWTEEPFVKLAVSFGDGKWAGPWSERFLYTGTEGETVKVSLYTDQKEAELFLNGKSLGKRELSDADGGRTVYEFPYEPGGLLARVPGAEDSLRTPGAASGISLALSETEIPADGESIVQIEVSLLDENGVPAAGDDRLLFYQVTGDAGILGIENGRPDDLTPYAEKSRETFRGRAICYVRAGLAPGEVTLTVFSRDGLSSSLTFRTV